MMNRLTKKIAYVLCMSSIMSLTTVESMPKEERNDNNNNNNTQIVKDVLNSYDIENGLLGVNRDIYVDLMAMLLENSLRNMGGVSGTIRQWIEHKSYVFCINSKRCRDIRLKRLHQSFSNWTNILQKNNVRMLYNGKAIVVAGNDGIFHSSDGRIYYKAFDDYNDIIVADGEYVVAENDRLSISNDCINWIEYPTNISFHRIAYDEVKKIYYGVNQDGIYISKDIAVLAAFEDANNINDPYSIYDRPNIFCGNGIVIWEKNNVYYFNDGDSWEKIKLDNPILDMFYDKKSKYMIALTNNYYLGESYMCSLDKTPPYWNVHISKCGQFWKRDFSISKHNFNTKYLNGYDNPIFATISGYTIMITQSGNEEGASIFAKTGNRSWVKINDIQIDKYDEIRQLIDTKYGTFMVTSNGIKKATGNIPDTEYKCEDYESESETETE